MPQLTLTARASLPITPTSAVVRQFDAQILACVAGESPTAQQRADLLAWMHEHLLSTYVADLLDLYPGPVPAFASKRRICPCRSSIEIAGNMLQGAIPLEPDHTFLCPPSGCPRALALSKKLPVWLRRRVVLAAQRTRLHDEMELTALWQAVEEHLLTGAMAWFDFTDYLQVDVPTLEALDVTTRGCLAAAHGTLGLIWTPAGAVQQD